jgi:hypothetical protein
LLLLLQKENKLTIMLSMDQDLYCTKNGIDPMEPTCARTMISGSALQLVANSTEFDFGTRAMQSRHPASVHWLKSKKKTLNIPDRLQFNFSSSIHSS